LLFQQHQSATSLPCLFSWYNNLQTFKYWSTYYMWCLHLKWINHGSNLLYGPCSQPHTTTHNFKMDYNYVGFPCY
jgi:hypothetical protein